MLALPEFQPGSQHHSTMPEAGEVESRDDDLQKRHARCGVIACNGTGHTSGWLAKQHSEVKFGYKHTLLSRAFT